MAKQDVRTTSAPAATTGATAEKGGEKIPPENFVKVDVEASSKSAKGIALRPPMTEPVVLTSLFIVRKHRIGFLNFLEPVFGVLFGASVRMVLSGETTKGVLEIRLRGRFLNAQDLVIVPFVSHPLRLRLLRRGARFQPHASPQRSNPQCGQNRSVGETGELQPRH